ncbi:MAG: DUF3810 domain-containing protein [Tissierellia bacterium]|nr:DUF3810 domain-containing protein [Tissierellia bacterium]
MKNNKIWIFIGLIPISVLITLIARNNPSYAEYYALNIYPIFVRTWGLFSLATRKSIAEIIIIFLLLTIILLTAFIIVKTIETKTFIYIKKYIYGIISFFSVVLFLFVLFCGINYYRYEFTHYSGLEIKESSKEELIELCETLIEDANKTRENLSENKDGTVELLDSHYHAAERAHSSMDKLSEEYSVLRGSYSSPKPVRNSKIMSYLRITGIFFPFTFEANVNVHIPPYQIPSVMLHELVHLRGFMREDEANFISYLACINSGQDDFYYSGTMMALTYSMNALYAEDYHEFVQLYSRYSDGVKRDMEFSRDYWKQFETKVADVSHKANDTYLKFNNQKDGVKSYGRMVDLLLAYYR